MQDSSAFTVVLADELIPSGVYRPRGLPSEGFYRVTAVVERLPQSLPPCLRGLYEDGVIVPNQVLFFRLCSDTDYTPSGVNDGIRDSASSHTVEYRRYFGDEAEYK